MFAFGRWLCIGDILALVSGRIDLPIVAQWLDPVTFGAYAVALNLASKVEVINHSLFTVMLPEAAAAAGPDVTRRFLAGGFRRTAVVTALLLLTVPIALPLINWLYGSGFAAVGPIFVGLLLVAIVDLLATPLLLLPFQLNRPRLLAAALSAARDPVTPTIRTKGSDARMAPKVFAADHNRSRASFRAIRWSTRNFLSTRVTYPWSKANSPDSIAPSMAA